MRFAEKGIVVLTSIVAAADGLGINSSPGVNHLSESNYVPSYYHNNQQLQ